MLLLPEVISTEAELDDVMTRPSESLIQFISTVASPLVVLGAGGKMGPSLAVLAKRAADAARYPLDVIAVSRFSDAAAQQWLTERGVTTIAADLLERSAVQQLPDARDIIYLVGMKFGTSAQPARTWAINSLVPSLICERYPRARIAALSTGNVYPLAAVASGGSRESDALTPLGEYANAAVARERIFEWCAPRHGTQVAQLRLSYALDLRYGVVAELARRVWRGEPIELATGHFNGIWQGDANDLILRALDLAALPVEPFNLTSTSIYSVRETAQQLGVLLDRTPIFVGDESGTGFVSNTTRLTERLGAPRTPLEHVLKWAAHWVRHGGRSLNKPTHFEVRDGQF